MKNNPVLLLIVLAAAITVRAQETPNSSHLEPVTSPPSFGTFYFAQRTNVPPFWFDPFGGQLPIYAIGNNRYVIDDTQVDYTGSKQSAMSPDGGEMMLSGGFSPCEECPPGDTNSYPKYLGGWTTNAGLKFAPTPVVQAGIFSTWLREADTNSAYEIYETFQLSTNAANTVWNRIVAGQLGQTNFSWSLTTSDKAFYSAADAIDSDFDGLSDAFEQRVSHTLPLDDDTDNDGTLDGDEDFNGNGIPDSADYSRLSQAVIFSSRATAFEGGLDGEVTVLLPLAAPSNGTTITLHLGGTAEFNSDYQLFTLGGQSVTNDLVFSAGDLQKKLLIRAINDSEQAPRARHVSIALVTSTNFLLDPRRADVALIENDLPSVAIIANDRTAAELAVSATNKGTFIVRREGSNGAPLTVRFNTTGSTASSGVDYTSLGTSVVIPAGSNEVRLTVTPLFDSEFEGTESVTLNVESDSAYVISAAGSATVQILDDDLPTVSFIGTDLVATEYNSLKAATITLRRTGNPAKPLTVPLAVGGNATNGSDYQIFTNNVLWTGSNVTFAANSSNVTITVKPLADVLEEQAETVVFTIKGSVKYQIGSSNSVTAFIDDDHTTRYEVVQLKIATVYEPGVIDSPAVYELRRWGISSSSATVAFQMWTNASGAPIRTTFYRVSFGDVSGENFVFAAFATKARVGLTATLGGSKGTGSDAISLRVPSIDTSEYPMWFRPKHEFIRASVVDTNAVEGGSAKAKIRFTRLYNGPAVSVYFRVWGNAIPAGFLTPDHDLYQVVEFQMLTNVLTVDTNITALTDGALEGWETAVIATETNSIQTTYEFRSPLMAFLRDNVSSLIGLPESDTDLDGLADRWEVANGFDPFIPGEQALDPDKDGLTNAEESALNSNPNSDDTDGDGEDDFVEANRKGVTDEDYLEVRFFAQDLGKVNNGMNCAVCHTTVLRVGDKFNFSPKHTSAAEKSFLFKRGTNYPIYLSRLVQDLLPTGAGGNPTTTETYTQGIVPALNEPRGFVVNDPNHKLGTNKPWANFPADPTLSIGTLIVPRIEVFWTNYPGNIALDNNTNAGGGVRVFPDQTSPTDNSTTRNRVWVRVKTTPPLPNQVVRLKSFDVDDPTEENDEVKVDDNDVPGLSAIGNDNRGAPQTGQLAQVTLTLDANGEATTDFTVTMQPGDNFRVAALLDTTGAAAHLNQLQVTSSEFGEFYVGPNNEGIIGFVGGISPMLTVWRKLHLEFDSMAAPPSSEPQAIFISGTLKSLSPNSPAAGLSVVRVSHFAREVGYNLLQNGKIIISGTAYKIRNSTSLRAGSAGTTYLQIQGVPPGNSVGTTVQMYDDDDQYLSNDPLFPSLLTLQSPPLPAAHHIGPFLDTNRWRFAEAYITLVDANAMGWNTLATINFHRHADIGGDTPFDAGNLQLKGTDRAAFWSYSVVFAYQPLEKEDGDPNKESPTAGVTPELFGVVLQPYSAVYLESIRERVFAVPPQLFTSPSDAADLRTHYLEDLYVVTAHEIGHAPGRQTGGTDHDEEYVMKIGADGVSRAPFSSRTIRRFRNATSWTQ